MIIHYTGLYIIHDYAGHRLYLEVLRQVLANVLSDVSIDLMEAEGLTFFFFKIYLVTRSQQINQHIGEHLVAQVAP